MKFIKIRDVKSPNRGTPKSAGVDFFIPQDFPQTVINPGKSVLIPSGIKMNVPHEHVFIAHNKSGVATKKSLQVGACVVDEDYQGEIHIHLINIGAAPVIIEPGDKIVQFLLLPIVYESLEEVENETELWEGKESERGSGGFGSTGVN